MANTDTLINDVSDTSLWVAYYRAKESKRKNALFKDPLAEILVGERGKKIAEYMSVSSRYSEYTVIMRTVVIDEYIYNMIREGVDTIINLGAGLDTRPYRMNLPQTLKWVEVDYPHIIALKNNFLKNEKPTCQLSRIELDLADNQKRKAFLQQAATASKKIMVITEGVVLYLTEAQVSDLAADLLSFPSFVYWIVEYMSPEVYPHLQNTVRSQKLKNAPFLFFPKDWIGFFSQRGWVPKEIKYLGEEGLKLGRPMPLPPIAFLFKIIMPKAAFDKARKMTGFILFQRKS